MKRESLTARQRDTWLWCALLSPLIRAESAAAGRGAWLTPLLALPAALLLGKGLGSLAMRRSPLTTPGRIGAAVFGCWCLYYGGFVLRAGADRFVSAVYTESPAWLFLAVMTLLALMAGLGPLRALGRFAELAAPVLGGIFALVFVFSAETVALRELWPLSGQDLLRAAAGVPFFLALLSVGAYFLWLPSDGEAKAGGYVRPLGALCLLGTLLRAVTAGSFGASLAGRMNYPFFVLLRNLHVFHLLDRMEALVAGQWVVTDFLLSAALLHLAARTLAAAVRGDERPPRPWLVCLGAAAMFLAGTLCASSSFALRMLGERWIPRGHLLALAFGAAPRFLPAGKRRDTLL